MAKNKGNGGGRVGAVRGRTQFQLPDGHYAKRDRWTGEILAIKADLKPFKGIVRERPEELPIRVLESDAGPAGSRESRVTEFLEPLSRAA
ncbi:MAG TPA: hypothetical protein VFQ54_13435 [Thermomicrobiales bacterium]|nr:hypothetical protein [Thermomicrobiales bacterium]